MSGEALDVEVLEPVPHPAVGHTPPQKYEEGIRLEVVRRFTEEGKKITQIAREMNIDRRTVAGIISEIEEDVKMDAKGEDLRLVGRLGDRVNELLETFTKTKMEAASLRDSAIALGVLVDKRKDLLGPRSGSSGVSLKIAWKDGTGAVELTTNGND